MHIYNFIPKSFTNPKNRLSFGCDCTGCKELTQELIEKNNAEPNRLKDYLEISTRPGEDGHEGRIKEESDFIHSLYPDELENLINEINNGSENKRKFLNPDDLVT